MPTDTREPRPLEGLRDPEGLSVTEAARTSGYHPQTIYGWIRDGKLPVTKFGPTRGVSRIHKQDLDDAVHGRT